MCTNSIDQSLESFINTYKDTLKKEESANYVAVPEKLAVFRYTLDNIGKCVRGAKVTSEMFKPFKSMAYITLTGRHIEIIDTVAFVELIKMASNIEVSLKTNGSTVLDIAYHGFAKPTSNGGI